MDFAKVISNSYHLPIVGPHQRVDICPIRSFWPDTFNMGTRVQKISLKNVTAMLHRFTKF